MKKLVAISVLFVMLSAAVFAQDDEGKWKVGFSAGFATDMLKATSMSGKSESTSGSVTTSSEFGALNKGSIDFFPNVYSLGDLKNRLSVSFSNSGENYDVWADIAINDWANSDNSFGAGGSGGTTMTIGQFLLNGKTETDWYAKGTAGIFNAQVGTAGYGGFVSPRSTWNDWYGWNAICKFGVYTFNEYSGNGDLSGFQVGDDFRTQPEWGDIVALGVALGDNYKFSVGYRIRPFWANNVWDQPSNPAGSKSSINGSFMLNGRVTDGIAFDLFYSVIGSDPNTFSRPTNTFAAPINIPSGSWSNIVGAYVGIDAIENLGLSLGYTVHFQAYEKGGYIPAADAGDPTKSKPVTITAPLYSGVDVRLSYSGIDKVGLTFNNNLSFAGVKGKEIKTDGTSEEYILDFTSHDWAPVVLNEKQSSNWFHLETELKASLGFIDGVPLTLHLGDRLMSISSEDTTTGVATSTSKSKYSDNEFRVSLYTDHGVGAVTVGAGLFFSVRSKALESEGTLAGTAVKTTASSSVTTFGIPVYFKVAF